MSSRAEGTFSTKGYREEPYNEVDGQKLAHASQTDLFHGDLQAEGTLEYLVAYREDGSALFVGLERVVGRLGQRSGSFALQSSGTYQPGQPMDCTWTVVPGSGTGELQGLTGGGGYTFEPGERTIPFSLHYDLE
jgi:hypothetical protein